MSQKNNLILAVLFIALLLPIANAAVTVTMNEPTTNTVYNNSPANRPIVDLNFTVVDTNSTDATNFSSRGLWVECYYYGRDSTGYGKAGTLITDWNGQVSTNADQNCVQNLGNAGAWSTPGRDCTFRWTVPLDLTMPNGDYVVDCNAISWYDANNPGAVDYHDVNANADTNASIIVTINNRISSIAVVRSLMSTGNLVVAGLTLLSIIGALVIGVRDPKTLGMLAVVALVIAAIGTSIAGAIMGLM